jgi:hypothetical protein
MKQDGEQEHQHVHLVVVAHPVMEQHDGALRANGFIRLSVKVSSLLVMASNLLFNLSSKASVQSLMYTLVLSKPARTLSVRSSAYIGRVTSFAFEAAPAEFLAMIEPGIFRENSSRIQQSARTNQFNKSVQNSRIKSVLFFASKSI